MNSPSTSSDSSSDAAHTARSMGQSLAPVIAMGATWGARKAMVKGYEKGTGKPAPTVRSHQASILSKVLWAAALGAVVALAESLIWNVLREKDQT